jgi:RimJ/RimL family protein N-acetyltransferase
LLIWSWATDDDAEEFEQFYCTGANAQPWEQETENYVRFWVLRRARYVLCHRDESSALIAVSAFDENLIAMPVISPLDHPGWHLQVVAITVGHQNQGLSQEVFKGTFDAMKHVDPDRVFVTANVHQDHAFSRRACEKVGLSPWIRLDDAYWILLGEVADD